MRLLEVGSARGDTAFFFAPLVAEVVGIDAAETAVAVARAAAAARGLSNVRFETADARDLAPFGDGSFDAVLLADFVEHVTDDVLRPCLAEALRVLAPGGALGDLHAEPRPLGRAGQGRRPGPPAGGPHRRPAGGRGRPARRRAPASPRRPLLLREPLPAPRRRRPPLPAGRRSAGSGPSSGRSARLTRSPAGTAGAAPGLNLGHRGTLPSPHLPRERTTR